MGNSPNHLQGIHGQGKVRGGYFFKVMELSGNCVISQGIFGIKHKVGEKSGNFEITSHGKVREFLNISLYGKT